MESNEKQQLLRLLLERSVHRGTFTLASGAQSDLYIDARQTTLDPRGAILIGRVGWEIIKQTAASLNTSIDSIGGLTMGAEPIALSISIRAHLEDPSSNLQTFVVRKAAKVHGRQKLIEGNFAPHHTVVVIEDVMTTGGSALQAIDAIQAAGGKVAFILVLVDRQEGGRETIEHRGHTVVPLFTRSDIVSAAQP